jgi:hypothetical protein
MARQTNPQMAPGGGGGTSRAARIVHKVVGKPPAAAPKPKPGANEPVIKLKIKPGDATVANAKVARTKGGISGPGGKNVTPDYKETGVKVLGPITKAWKPVPGQPNQIQMTPSHKLSPRNPYWDPTSFNK